jgi:predicted permease
MVPADARHALRSLRAGRGLVAASVLTLAVGLGPHVAAFGLFDRLFLRPLPFADPDRLVQIHLAVSRDPDIGQALLPYVYAEALERRTDIFSGLAYASGHTRVETHPVPGENPLVLSALSPRSLGVLGLRPALGRGMTADDARSRPTAVWLTHDTWARRYLRSPDVLSLSWVDGRSYRVAGVLPEAFVLPSSRLLEHIDGVTVYDATLVPDDMRRGFLITAPFARLQPGVSIAQAQAAASATVFMMPWEATDNPPEGNPAARLTVLPLQSGIGVLVRPYLWLLFGGAWLVFAVACVNLMVLLHTWARAREREIGIRLALGATTAALGRAVLLEATAICGLGALMAWVTYAATDSQLLGILPARLRGFAVPATDTRLVGGIILATFCAALAVSLVPIRAALSVDLVDVVDRRRGQGRRGSRLASFVLLAAESALAAVVVFGAAAVVPSYVGLLVRSPGFEATDLHVARVSHGRASGEAPAMSMRERVGGILDAVGTVTGVRQAAASLTFDPIGGASDDELFWPRDGVDGHLLGVSRGYFDVVGASMAAGRGFSESEADGSAAVILNEAAVAVEWPGAAPQEAIGRTLDTRQGVRTVVGVVRDMRTVPGMPAIPSIYLPIADPALTVAPSNLPILLRMEEGRVPDAGLLTRELDQRLSSGRVRLESVSADLEAWLEAPRLLAVWLGVAGLTAIAMVATALFAATTFEVTRRRDELSIRLALGASAWRLRRLIFGLSVPPVACGVIVGLIAAGLLSRIVEPVGDSRAASTYLTASAVVVTIGLVASWRPAVARLRLKAASVLRSM